MHITLVVACSVDGYIVDEAHAPLSSWVSKEDAVHFKALLQQFPLQVMGRRTYEVHHPRPEKDTLKIVLTHRPHDYLKFATPGQLEFHRLEPREFIQAFNEQDKCLVLGGADVYNDFLESKVVSEVFVTQEPVALHSGTRFLRAGKTLEDYGLVLRDTLTLNNEGTVLKHYLLIK